MIIPVGISDFRDIRENGYYYVDKSKMIKELLTDVGTKVTLITMPRRLGKTLNMSMLAEFFDVSRDSRPLFEELFISGEKTLCSEWMNQYPTVFITFKSVTGLNFELAYGELIRNISELYKRYDVESNREHSEGRSDVITQRCFVMEWPAVKKDA